MAGFKSVLVAEVAAVDRLAVSVELQLVRRTVPDPHRTGSPISLPIRKDLLRSSARTIDPIHDGERAAFATNLLARTRSASQRPESCSLLNKSRAPTSARTEYRRPFGDRRGPRVDPGPVGFGGRSRPGPSWSLSAGGTFAPIATIFDFAERGHGDSSSRPRNWDARHAAKRQARRRPGSLRLARDGQFLVYGFPRGPASCRSSRSHQSPGRAGPLGLPGRIEIAAHTMRAVTLTRQLSSLRRRCQSVGSRRADGLVFRWRKRMRVRRPIAKTASEARSPSSRDCWFCSTMASAVSGGTPASSSALRRSVVGDERNATGQFDLRG